MNYRIFSHFILILSLLSVSTMSAKIESWKIEEHIISRVIFQTQNGNIVNDGDQPFTQLSLYVPVERYKRMSTSSFEDSFGEALEHTAQEIEDAEYIDGSRYVRIVLGFKKPILPGDSRSINLEMAFTGPWTFRPKRIDLFVT